MRKLMLIGAALGVVMTKPAWAQVQAPGFFGSLAGWYAFEVSNSSSVTFTSSQVSRRGNLDDGFGGKLHAGFAWANGLDVAVGAQSTFPGRGRALAQGVLRLAEKADVQAYDIEIGYNLPAADGKFRGVRVFAGARYANFDHRGRGMDNSGPLTRTTDAWGIGPRVGADASLRLVDALSLFGGVGTSFLFGSVRERTASPGFPGSFKDDRFIFQIDAQIGLKYEIAPLVSLAAGFRLDAWDGAGQSGLFTGAGFGKNGRLSRTIYGPFARLAYNW